ncbi:peroxiredoxin [Pontibacter sp. SGAir0037]|uniref:peroxiredoxin n=1 Tax=Pontibacter sp. SGAir0037 TaxID=2571030 RepID=UPI0010CCDCBE|nr:peroxiredoxin [Pontibacter sp. SGAir0037]QCR23128.1 peroxiredoxin [Pontibacter sp. SGAir0037]
MSRETVQIGDKAPDFELQRCNGGFFRLYDVLKEKNVVLYFYPKDNTSGCTKQACKFRDQYDAFKEQGAEVIGISSDSFESHKRFERVYHLPFTLLSDKGGSIRKLYGVKRNMLLLPGRVTYIIDKQGIVRYIYDSMNNPVEHVDKALEMLQLLREEEMQPV